MTDLEKLTAALANWDAGPKGTPDELTARFLAELRAGGLVVVPRQPTVAMLRATGSHPDAAKFWADMAPEGEVR